MDDKLLQHGSEIRAMKSSARNPFIDPDGYKNFVAQKEQEFRTELAKQTLAAK